QPAVASPTRRQQPEGGGRSASSPPGAGAAAQGEEAEPRSPISWRLAVVLFTVLLPGSHFHLL
uniref:Uncharacterized protein n=1 Tax=Peromyscus maniculatus bairdii TaxID=230844 RepID=A0A8C8UAN6_PERMB